MARTTLNIDDSVLRQVRAHAKRAGKGLAQVVSELLSIALAQERTSEPERGFTWHAQDLKPLIDIDDKDALHDALDGR